MITLMKFLKRTLALLLAVILIGVIAFNIRLYYHPTYTASALNQDLLHQLAHLKEELHGGAANDMQRLYPEGYVFLNALYGLTWIEVAEWLSPTDEGYAAAHEEIDWVLAELDAPQAKRTFHEFVEPAYGIFYRGWSNYVLARKLKLVPKEQRDSATVQTFHDTCEDIIQALRLQKTPFLESYSNACWPADMTVGMASIAIHEELFPGKYEGDIKGWLDKVKERTDSLGLIPHKSAPLTGAVLEPARGSSQSLILSFLLEIDSTYAKTQFQRYQEIFLAERLGLPGIREYPAGYAGEEDIDSGPVIWKIGGAASIVGQRTMALYGESTTAVGLRNSIEAFGVGNTTDGKKAYLFGVLAMADAFIAWSNSTEAHASKQLKASAFWRIKTHLLSLAVLVLGMWAVRRLWRRK